MYKPIRDYAIIGNLRSAALVAKDGSIDWKPAPYLDSPSVFAAILDDKKGGKWSIAPSGSYDAEQEYLGQTNILITRFTTRTGVAELIDFIPAQPGRDMKEIEKAEVHRKLVCAKGVCELKVEFSPRFDYARGETTLSLMEHGIAVYHEGNKRGELVGPGAYVLDENGASCVLRMEEGETAYFTFHYHDTVPEEWEAPHHEKELEATKKFWEDWVHHCDLNTCAFAGPWHEMVVRSSLVLKILFFEPPGSIAAAATTSLPEAVGGKRNWDYRFSWIRDSAFTLQALFLMGYDAEARRYMDWLLRECCNVEAFQPEDMQVMYGLRGEKDLTEEVLSHLEGYRGSHPVRIGNKASLQKQWDIYGSLLDTVWRIHRFDPTYEIPEYTWDIFRKLAQYVVKVWREPDEGIWEVRGGKRHFVYSKVMCWVALDRALKIAEAYGFEGEIELWKKEKEAIREEVMKRGWSEEKKSFVQSFDSTGLDVSLLLLAAVGFIQGNDEKMLLTIQAIQRELSLENGLLLRYTEAVGLHTRKEAFVPASFWLIDALALAGQKEEAREHFIKMVEYANHLGLYAEQMDPSSFEFLGNFPQAYAHIGLINSAFYLADETRFEEKKKITYTRPIETV
ncbi:MAG: glycoside hydrolase family 15 protein [Candidatus Yanofskybacteria bacterium]|nr:glycoside hydrolase family 15 protein [Candidatus Yanofskybacteria bacterium]